MTEGGGDCKGRIITPPFNNPAFRNKLKVIRWCYLGDNSHLHAELSKLDFQSHLSNEWG